MKLIPLGDRVLVKVEKAGDKTKTGLFIPQTAQEKTQIGSVEAVGDSDDIKVKTGQKVMYDKYAGTAVELGDEDFLVVKMDDIIAIVE